jgi:hypothetical protein
MFSFSMCVISDAALRRGKQTQITNNVHRMNDRVTSQINTQKAVRLRLPGISHISVTI